MHPMLNIAIQAARLAGSNIARASDRLDRIRLERKGFNDWVSNIDKEAEETIIAHLRQFYPDHHIIGEESGDVPANDSPTSTQEYCWIIDPLDGTANFLKGLPHFSVSIALLVRGQLEVGVIYDPIRDEIFAASRGHGATLNNKRIRVSTSKELENCFIATGFPFRQHEILPTYLKQFEDIFKQVIDIRRTGSAALDLAYVAAGRLDGYWENTVYPWDIAAGCLIVQEAGGAVFDFIGQQNMFDRTECIAGNQKIAPQLLRLLAKHPIRKTTQP